MKISRRPLTKSERDLMRWMLDNSYTYRAMAKRFDICTDTLKRILMREGIAEFEGAKYVVAPAALEQTWTRPCIKCRAKAARPKWQYICDTCKSDAPEGLPDSWLEMDS
jgi:hypothetical protein